MDANDLKELIGSLGFPIVVVIYFLWRDYKFNARLVRFMQEIVTLLERINGGDK